MLHISTTVPTTAEELLLELQCGASHNLNGFTDCIKTIERYEYSNNYSGMRYVIITQCSWHVDYIELNVLRAQLELADYLSHT